MAKQNIQLAATEVISLPQPPLRKAEDYLKAYLRKKKISVLQELPEKIDFLQNLASRMWRNIYV